jgi:hypothetical protein
MQEKYRDPVDRPRVMHVEDEPVSREAGDSLAAHGTPFHATLRMAAQDVNSPFPTENPGYGDPLAHGRSWFCLNPPLIDVLGQPWSAGFCGATPRPRCRRPRGAPKVRS